MSTHYKPGTTVVYVGQIDSFIPVRSEERRGGKEWRYRRDWSPDGCSSDLAIHLAPHRRPPPPHAPRRFPWEGRAPPSQGRIWYMTPTARPLFRSHEHAL